MRVARAAAGEVTRERGTERGERPSGGRRSRVSLSAACSVLLLLLPAATRAQGNPGQAVSKPWEPLLRTVEVNDVAISPDGRWVAWAQERNGERGPVNVLDRRGGAAVPVRAGEGALHPGSSPAFSPDSASLAFVSEGAEKGQDQVWVARADGTGARRVTAVHGYVGRPRWSPDGRRLAFLHVEGARAGGPLAAHEARSGVIEQVVRNQRIAVVDVSSGDVHLASPPQLHVYDYDWSPDGRSFAVTAAPGPGDDNWWVAALYVVDGATASVRLVYRPSRQIAIPRWSPDGTRIAFIEGLMSDEGVHGGDLFTVSAEGGPAQDHTSGRKSSPSWATWLSPSRLLFAEFEGGGSALSTLDVASGSAATLWRGPEAVTAGGYTTTFAVARDGSTSVLARQRFDLPPEVWTGPIGGWVQATRLNADQRATWGDAESLRWGSDGLDVQGWLIPPKVVEPGRRYPMAVVVHGGPSSVVTSRWPGNMALAGPLVAQGYFVLLPNPRGSYGQGEAFTRANVRDFGGGDLRDILAGVDAAIARFPVDPQRVGITGWSYGGYMTMWAVTQTERFRAAMAGAGVANWQSYYGQNLIDTWMIPFFGASVYHDPAVYAKSSPINFITRAKTPTLVIVGEADAECPAPQSFEFWHALKTLGVPTQLVVYPGEGHEFADPAHRRDRIERTIAWFEKYLAGTAGAPDPR